MGISPGARTLRQKSSNNHDLENPNKIGSSERQKLQHSGGLFFSTQEGDKIIITAEQVAVGSQNFDETRYINKDLHEAQKNQSMRSN